MKKTSKVNASIILPKELWKKVKKVDPTGREKFTSGLIFILNDWFKNKGEA